MQQETRSDSSINMSRRVSITAIMTGLALTGNYIFVGIPNVELGSAILFITGYVFGFRISASCSLLTAIIFGSINPWGGLIPQIWITQLIGWMYIAFAGSLIGSRGHSASSRLTKDWQLGLVGAFLTFYFDLLTNLGYAWATGISYWITLLAGLSFMIIHVVSNAIIFAGVTLRLDSIIRTQFASLIWDPGTQLSILREE
ncbi:MAG: hypothetical protein ACXAEE_09485 [Candidatus Thorarchaeota archaeon]